MEVAELTVQPTQDPNIMVFHTRVQLTESPLESGMRGESGGLGALGELILEVRGVEGVKVLPYMLLVQKAPLFAWDEVEPTITGHMAELIRSSRLLREDFSATLADDKRKKPRAARSRVQKKS